MEKMKQILFWAAIVLLFAACREDGAAYTPEEINPKPIPEVIPEIPWTWEKPEDLQALCVYLGFEQDPSGVTQEEIEKIWHNTGRIMIPYIGYKRNGYGDLINGGIVKMLKCSEKPSGAEVDRLIDSLQSNPNYCNFSELKNSLDYFLYKGRAVCVDIHEFVGYIQYTYKTEEEKDESLFSDGEKQILLKEFELQIAGFLMDEYSDQVKAGNISLEILNEPKADSWENIQLYVAKAIHKQFPDLWLGIRPNQSYSVDCLRNTWFEPNDYAGMKTVVFLNFWFMERPDLGASPVDFTIQYETFEKYRNGENVEFNIFGDWAIGHYSNKEYEISPDTLGVEFKMTADWAEDNNTKVFFAELGCIRYADPEGQYFLYCLRYGQEYGIGIALFEVGAKYFFQYDGDVPFYLNDKNWAGFKYLQMDPGEIAFEEPLW
ncbi:MAG: hypothetical protein WC545_02920 [Patescibacteria group bacterium]